MKNKLQKNKFKKGFTLIELMIVIAIIGILTSVVTVSMSGATAKAKRTSALTTASSVLPEIVTCEDDGGDIAGPDTTSGGGIICDASGHTAEWPSLGTTGWIYAVPDTGNGDIPAMSYALTKTSEADIVCDVSENGCE